MEIRLTWGVGKGSTEISAFDNALYDAGISNYNLIRLSSIVPTSSKVIIKKIDWNKKEHGDKLYVVLSDGIETKPGKEIWAGIGWIQNKEGKGIFVEQIGDSKKSLINSIKISLKEMQKNRSEKFGEINMKITNTKCVDKPVCALVSAVFKSEKW